MKISRIRDVKMPNRGTRKSAGIDFYVPNDLDFDKYLEYNDLSNFCFRDGVCSVAPHSRIVVPSGVKVRVPSGYALIAFNKGGVAVKKGLDHGACVIDEDYEGEVFLNFINTTNKPVGIKNGEKISQLILINVFYDDIEEVEDRFLYSVSKRWEKERGTGCLGSTGEE